MPLIRRLIQARHLGSRLRCSLDCLRNNPNETKKSLAIFLAIFVSFRVFSAATDGGAGNRVGREFLWDIRRGRAFEAR